MSACLAGGGSSRVTRERPSSPGAIADQSLELTQRASADDRRLHNYEPSRSSEDAGQPAYSSYAPTWFLLYMPPGNAEAMVHLIRHTIKQKVALSRIFPTHHESFTSRT
jgi:hypothetical protein